VRVLQDVFCFFFDFFMPADSVLFCLLLTLTLESLVLILLPLVNPFAHGFKDSFDFGIDEALCLFHGFIIHDYSEKGSIIFMFFLVEYQRVTMFHGNVPQKVKN